MSRVVLAVDGGNSKTDLALVREDGALLAHVRGALSSPHHLGLEGALEVLRALLDDAVALAGIEEDKEPIADVAEIFLAGVDFPDEEARLREALAARAWARLTEVGNDTFAVLRAGTARGWGIAVVCGAGINCVGVAPDGRQVRFPALGAITGDWGGGYDVGLAALTAAARSADGRGPATELERLVPAHYGYEDPVALATAIHRGAVPHRRLLELAPLVFAAAATDKVASEIVDHLAVEIVALAGAALRRLGLEHEPTDVVLGGGLVRAGDERLLGEIARGLAAIGPYLVLRASRLPPVVGAVLLGLDALGADTEARERAASELAAVLGSGSCEAGDAEPSPAEEVVRGG